MGLMTNYNLKLTCSCGGTLEALLKYSSEVREMDRKFWEVHKICLEGNHEDNDKALGDASTEQG